MLQEVAILISWRMAEEDRTEVLKRLENLVAILISWRMAEEEMEKQAMQAEVKCRNPYILENG